MRLPPPEVFGLPKKYIAWRENQDLSIQQILDSKRRVKVQVCPTGFGKSLSSIAAGIILGGKVVVLTSTKGLQSQYMRDFSEIGMVDVRGRNSYMCPAGGGTGSLTCEEGPCTVGFKCDLKHGGCPYYDAVRAASKASLVVTNYSYWFFANEYAEGIGTPNVLVCDEAHDSPDAVANFLTIEFERRDDLLMQILPTIPEHLTIYDWKKWAVQTQNIVEEEMESLADQALMGSERAAKRLKILRRISKQIVSLKSLEPANWVMNVSPMTIAFAPISVANYAQAILLGTIKHVIPTSASVCAKTMEMIGLAMDSCELIEYPHTFPIENRMLIKIPGVRLNAKTTDEGLKDWVGIIDRIIKYRLDRKGIIHTVSYDRRSLVMSMSKYAHIMMTHVTRDAVQKVQEFKRAAPPKVLVSPSMATGWDFPGSLCEYQIIGKIAYPDTRNKITKARCDADPEYAPYIAMQQLVQTCGRGVRSATDRCENFMIDANASWFIPRYELFAPKWFTEAIVERILPPAPPPKIIDKLEETDYAETQ
uniref:Putative helicase n=1 Tax=viral metagenome TaxID=1070528 RepID=A0A6M3XS36_9ZZZZ